MFCRFCGKQISDDSIFCPACGGEVAPLNNGFNNNQQNAQGAQNTQSAQTNPNYTYQSTQGNSSYAYQQPATPNNPNPVKESLAGSILTFAILGVVFANTFFLSFMGIIFSAISRSKYNAFVMQYGVPSGRAKVGGIMSKIALIVSIVVTAIVGFYLFIILIILASL